MTEKQTSRMLRYRVASTLRRVTRAGAQELSTWTMMDIPNSLLLAEGYIRRWSGSFPDTLINALAFSSGIWATAPSRNWARRPAPALSSGTQAGAALSEILIMMVISTS